MPATTKYRERIESKETIKIAGEELRREGGSMQFRKEQKKGRLENVSLSYRVTEMKDHVKQKKSSVNYCRVKSPKDC